MLAAILAVLLPLLASILYQPIFTDNTLNHSLDNILFVTAHPDDECMFFAPTILGLQAASNPPKVHILSLSFGNASGLGEIRQGEFIASLNVLGIPEGRRHILDHPELQDGMRTKWDPELISKMLNFYVVQHNISKILTFDPQGISGHSNHRAAFHGVRHYTQTHTPAPQLFTLITVPNAIKYLSIVAPLQAKIDLFVARFLNFVEVTLESSDSAKPVEVVYEKTLPVFVSGFNEYLTAHRAMRQHWSQLVWFRWLYVIFSRYMWVNEWQQLKT